MEMSKFARLAHYLALRIMTIQLLLQDSIQTIQKAVVRPPTDSDVNINRRQTLRREKLFSMHFSCVLFNVE